VEGIRLTGSQDGAGGPAVRVHVAPWLTDHPVCCQPSSGDRVKSTSYGWRLCMKRGVALRHLFGLHLPLPFLIILSFGCSVRNVPLSIIGARNPSLCNNSVLSFGLLGAS